MNPCGRPAPAGLRLVHYWWPVVMAWSFSIVVGRATGSPIATAGTSMLLLGVLAAYSFDRLWDTKSSPQPRWLRLVLALGLGAAFFGALGILPDLPRSKVAFLAALALVALGYPWMKKLPWVKTILVPGVWTVAAIALPVGWRTVLTPVAVPLFLVVAAGCLLCDVKDVDADSRSGVRSLPVAVGVGRSLALAGSLAVAGAAFAWHDHRSGLAICGLSLAALAPWRNLLAAETIGPLAVDILLTLPGLWICLHRV